MGITLSVYLVQRTQVFKSKASNHAVQAITVIQENNDRRTEVAPAEESGVPVFEVEGSSTIKLKLKDDPQILDLFRE